ncbi:UDP-N-acetylmuramoyl-L-alanine--D-glutamate ligase [Rhodospirillaceae bacterium SYSU D60014]|uniref:UDP-N-acetylmuramoyl-L-alanine--D-glutamate ligase n=1 Tax=Virgifigura deserti TaxID=2268457 RepID=UPI000E65F192
MIRPPFPPDRPVAVLGLGGSGLATGRALAASGAEIWAWDDSAERRAAAEMAGMSLTDLSRCDWTRPSSLVLSPGIPHTHPAPHPVAQLARNADCPIIGDIELLARAQPKATYLGITGTNGKSTTTALIGHLMQSAGRRVEVGGNLGTPALALEPLEAGGSYVLECSSYQLELMRSARFDVAALLNISPDHLDRHGGMAGYIAAKKRIFAKQVAPQTAVIGVDDIHCQEIHAGLAAKGEQIVIPVSARGPVPGGVYVEKGLLIDDSHGRAQSVLDMRLAPTLPGGHNWQNAAAACAACRAAGLEVAEIADGLQSFPGLAHRQELIALLDGVRYVNDSKATNADATARALACYDPIYWIVGGKPKEGGLAGLDRYYPRIAHAFLIGEAAAVFAEQLAGKVAVTQSGTLDNAVSAAHALAQAQGRPGAVVLLSPACASFDQFANFEERGLAFRRLITALQNNRGGAPDSDLLRRAQ